MMSRVVIIFQNLISGYSELCRLLVFAGFNPHQRDNFGQVPLHLACISGDITTVRELCEVVRTPGVLIKVIFILWHVANHYLDYYLGSLINPLHAKFFIGNLKKYLHFISYHHTDMTQVVEILPHVIQELTCSTLHRGCRFSGDTRSQGISNHDIDYVEPEWSRPHTLTANWCDVEFIYEECKCFHFQSFFITDMPEVVKILPHGSQEPFSPGYWIPWLLIGSDGLMTQGVIVLT